MNKLFPLKGRIRILFYTGWNFDRDLFLRSMTILGFLKLGFVIAVAFSFPLVIFPCRTSIHSLIFRKVGCFCCFYINFSKVRVCVLSFKFWILSFGFWILNFEIWVGFELGLIWGWVFFELVLRFEFELNAVELKLFLCLDLPRNRINRACEWLHASNKVNIFY